MGILAEISHEIRRDIRPFSDPGSEVLCEDDQLLWTQHGVEREANLISTGGLPDIKIDGTKMAYKSFLASHHMADLNALARFIPKTTSLPDHYITTSATSTDHRDNMRTEPADQLVAELGTSTPFQSTRIVLVQGEAGSGKTITLKKMTVDRAKRYAVGQVESLFFYIDVQGRALSRLDDAMARDLQDLRSRFSYNAVAPLVRRGLLVPVIDGFDELLGSGGYDEAFSSLTSFVSLLDGAGDVIASARSTFFDYKSFNENADRYSNDGTLSYEIIPVQIEPWSDSDADDFVSRIVPQAHARARVVTQFAKIRQDMDESNRKLLGKPFYVARVADLLAKDSDSVSTGDILPQLVHSFIRREHGKLLDKEGNPLLDEVDHLEFLVRLAEEMWLLESRYLRVDDVKTLAELLVEELGKPHQASRQILDRVPMYAFLTTVDSPKKSLAFEHDVFYGYFLAHRLRQCITSNPIELRRFIHRSVIDETLADHAVRLLLSHDQGDCTDAIEAVCAVLRGQSNQGIARENGGRLVARMIASPGYLRPCVRISDVDFHGETLGLAELREPRFDRCHFNKTDFTGVRMLSPRFRKCFFQMPVVALQHTLFTDLEAAVADDFQGIAIAEHAASSSGGEYAAREYYAPDDVRAFLQQMGMQGDRDGIADPALRYSVDQRRRIEIVAKFLNKMERLRGVAREDITRFRFARGREWDFVYDRLEHHGLLKEEYRNRAGRRKAHIRLAYPPDVVRRGENTTDRSRPRVTSFWEDIVDKRS